MTSFGTASIFSISANFLSMAANAPGKSLLALETCQTYQGQSRGALRCTHFAVKEKELLGSTFDMNARYAYR